MKYLLLLALLFTGYTANANDVDVLDNKIEKFCNEHKLAKESTFDYKGTKMTNGERCTLIGQAQIRMETQSCTKGMALTLNNCFWLKTLWTNEFRKFSDNTKSIEYWTMRYYKYDYTKTIHEIVYWYWMLDKWGDWTYKWMYGYSWTDKEHYYQYVRKYFNDNYLK